MWKSLLKRVFDYITQLDQKRARSGAAMVLMLGLVSLLLVYGRAIGACASEHGIWLEIDEFSGTVWALPATFAVFTTAAFIGMPQWVLISASVLAFGPLTGAIYAWLATLVSASFDFWLGRQLGAETVERYGGALVNRLARMVRANGFFTSLTVRLVPTGPFILVNLAAGVSRVKFSAFFAGTALGIVPKIAFVASLGRGIVGVAEGRSYAFIVGSVVLVLIVFTIMLTGQRWLHLRREDLSVEEIKKET